MRREGNIKYVCLEKHRSNYLENNFSTVRQLVKIRTAKLLRCFTASENALRLIFNEVAFKRLNSIFMFVDFSVNPTQSLSISVLLNEI